MSFTPREAAANAYKRARLAPTRPARGASPLIGRGHMYDLEPKEAVDANRRLLTRRARSYAEAAMPSERRFSQEPSDDDLAGIVAWCDRQLADLAESAAT